MSPFRPTEMVGLVFFKYRNQSNRKEPETHRCGWLLQRYAEVVYCSRWRVNGLGKTAQQVAHLVRHVSQGDQFAPVSLGPEAGGSPTSAGRTAYPLGQFAEKEAAWQLSVELAESFLALKEIPEACAILQQQTHKLRLVANQSWDHSLVEVIGLDGDRPEEDNEHPSGQLDCSLLFGNLGWLVCNCWLIFLSGDLMD